MRRRRPTVAALCCAILAGVLNVPASPRQSTQEPAALDASHPITYFIADGSGRAGYRESDRELAQWAFASWQRSVGNGFRLEPVASESAALIRLRWIESDAPGYGEMRPVNVAGRRGALVYVRPDTDALGPVIAPSARDDVLLRETIVYLTCVHEIGHALGLAHTRDFRDIMYYFGYGGDVIEFFGRYRRQLRTRADIARYSGVSEGDVSRLRALYPGR
jgi:hypothetical protein